MLFDNVVDNRTQRNGGPAVFRYLAPVVALYGYVFICHWQRLSFRCKMRRSRRRARWTRVGFEETIRPHLGSPLSLLYRPRAPIALMLAAVSSSRTRLGIAR